MEKINIVRLDSLAKDKKEKFVKEICELTKKDDTVLSLDPGEIMDKLVVLLILNENGEWVATASLSEPNRNRYRMLGSEVGTMFTKEQYQHKGYATKLVCELKKIAKEEYKLDFLYSFLNGKSPKSFVRNGFTGEIVFSGLVVNAADLAPKEAFELCENICRDEDAQELTRISAKKPSARTKEEKEKYARAKMERTVRLLKTANIASSGNSDLPEKEKIYSLFEQNLNNELWCCDTVCVKMLNR